MFLKQIYTLIYDDQIKQDVSINISSMGEIKMGYGKDIRYWYPWCIGMVSVVSVLFKLVYVFIPHIASLQLAAHKLNAKKKFLYEQIPNEVGKEMSAGFISTSRQIAVMEVLINILNFASVASSFSIHLSTCIKRPRHCHNLVTPIWSSVLIQPKLQNN